MIIFAKAGRSNRELLQLKIGETAFDFTAAGVTKVEVYAGGQTISSTGAAVTFDGDTLDVDFCALNLPAGTYYPEIVFFIGSNPLPQTIAARGRPNSITLNFEV